MSLQLLGGGIWVCMRCPMSVLGVSVRMSEDGLCVYISGED